MMPFVIGPTHPLKVDSPIVALVAVDMMNLITTRATLDLIVQIDREVFAVFGDPTDSITIFIKGISMFLESLGLRWINYSKTFAIIVKVAGQFLNKIKVTGHQGFTPTGHT